MDLGKEMLAGTVYVKTHWRHKKRYAVAYCGRGRIGVVTEVAHLTIYKLKSPHSDVVERINFSTVLGLSAGPSGITLRLPDSLPDLRFRAKRRSGNKEWMKVCTLLNALPNYPIPEPPEPQRSLLRPELASLSTQYCELYNAHDAWVVQVLSDSVANAWNIVGLRIVTIGKEDSMLNVIHPTTGKAQLKVSRCDILRCGYWHSMVCLEISVGLRGVLWMDCFQDQVKQIRDKIHNFAFYGVEASLPPLPHFPRFFSDLPFSPRCYFDRLRRSRSTSLSSQCSESSDNRSNTLSSSLQLEGPRVNFTTHPSFVRSISPSTKHSQHLFRPRAVQLNSELVHREKRSCSILLEPRNPTDHRASTESYSVTPQDYLEPMSIKPNITTTSTLTTDQPEEHSAPTITHEEYIVMKATN